MEAIEYLKAKNKMTKECTVPCLYCPLEFNNNSEHMPCRDFESKYPERAVEIVEKWAKEHPKRTRQSELLKAFPMLELDCNQVVNICPRKIVNTYDCEVTPKDFIAFLKDELCSKCRKRFWLEEI